MNQKLEVGADRECQAYVKSNRGLCRLRFIDETASLLRLLLYSYIIILIHLC